MRLRIARSVYLFVDRFPILPHQRERALCDYPTPQKKHPGNGFNHSPVVLAGKRGLEDFFVFLPLCRDFDLDQFGKIFRYFSDPYMRQHVAAPIGYTFGSDNIVGPS